MSQSHLNFAKAGRSESSSPFPESRGSVDMSLFVAKRLAGVAIVAFAVGACSPQSSVAAAQDSQPAPAVAPSQPPSSPQPVGTLNGRELPDFATLVERVGPAVVNVSVVARSSRDARQDERVAEGDPVGEFVRRWGAPSGTRDRCSRPRPRASGLRSGGSSRPGPGATPKPRVPMPAQSGRRHRIPES